MTMDDWDNKGYLGVTEEYQGVLQVTRVTGRTRDDVS